MNFRWFLGVLPLIVCGCEGLVNSTGAVDLTTSESDIQFYGLQSSTHHSHNSEIEISLPDSGAFVEVLDSSAVFRFENFTQKTSVTKGPIVSVSKTTISGYAIELSKLKSKNTRDRSDEDYIGIMNQWFLNDAKGDLKRIEELLPPRLFDVKVIDFRADLRIHGKSFSQRIMYSKDEQSRGTLLEDVTGINFQYVTLHDGVKYTLNLDYYGDGKTASDLIGEFSAIAGTLRFR